MRIAKYEGNSNLDRNKLKLYQGFSCRLLALNVSEMNILNDE